MVGDELSLLSHSPILKGMHLDDLKTEAWFRV